MPKYKETFLQRQLRKIIIDEMKYNKVIKVETDIYNDVKSWSSLKLIFLNYYSDIYTKIMSNRFPGRYFYVDLFSGSGIGKVINNKNDLIFGSPLLMAAQRDFPKMFFCDSDPEYVRALKERLKVLDIADDKFVAYDKDCNSIVDDVISNIKKGHALIFIDPYCMEIKWETIEKILQLDADIIMNFQTSEIPRARTGGRIGSSMEGFFKNKDEVEKIYKPSCHEGTIRERLKNLYVSDIQNTRLEIDSKSSRRRKTIIESVKIKKDETFYYDLIFIVRETSNRNPWLKAISGAGKEIESLNSKDVQRILDVLKGRQKQLSLN